VRFATGTVGRAANTQNVLCRIDMNLQNLPIKTEGPGEIKI